MPVRPRTTKLEWGHHWYKEGHIFYADKGQKGKAEGRAVSHGDTIVWPDGQVCEVHVHPTYNNGYRGQCCELSGPPPGPCVPYPPTEAGASSVALYPPFLNQRPNNEGPPQGYPPQGQYSQGFPSQQPFQQQFDPPSPLSESVGHVRDAMNAGVLPRAAMDMVRPLTSNFKPHNHESSMNNFRPQMNSFGRATHIAARNTNVTGHAADVADHNANIPGPATNMFGPPFTVVGGATIMAFPSINDAQVRGPPSKDTTVAEPPSEAIDASESPSDTPSIEDLATPDTNAESPQKHKLTLKTDLAAGVTLETGLDHRPLTPIYPPLSPMATDSNYDVGFDSGDINWGDELDQIMEIDLGSMLTDMPDFK
jgi:hypothetical protein